MRLASVGVAIPNEMVPKTANNTITGGIQVFRADPNSCQVRSGWSGTRDAFGGESQAKERI